MKAVINIPDDWENNNGYPTLEELEEIIVNGILLPKGHGRLIDADAIKQNICTYEQTGCGSCKHQLCCPEDAPTI